MNVMKRCLSFLLLCFLFTSVVSQENNKKDQKNKQSQTQPAPPETPRPPLAFGLSEDTPVRLKLTRTMSSKDATLDEKVDFEVLEDVKVGDVVVVQHGGMAIATVTEAQHKRRMGRAGKLNINIDYVQLVSGDKVPLRAVKGGSGGNHTGAMTGAIVATSIVFFPAAPFFLFMHGKDITIPKGTEITAYIAGDTPLDPAKFQPAVAASGQGSVSSVATSSAKLQLESNPSGADIDVDGNFVGSTPSDIQISEGEHIVSVKKAGFTNWERKVKVSAGSNVHLSAELEK